jgi:hypothetical protein
MFLHANERLVAAKLVKRAFSFICCIQDFISLTSFDPSAMVAIAFYVSLRAR